MSRDKYTLVTERQRLQKQAALATEAERLHRAKVRALDDMDSYLETPGNTERDRTFVELELKCGRIVSHLVSVIKKLGTLTGMKYEMTYDGVLRPHCGGAILTETMASALFNREVAMIHVGDRSYRIMPLEQADGVGDLDAIAWAGALQ